MWYISEFYTGASCYKYVGVSYHVGNQHGCIVGRVCSKPQAQVSRESLVYQLKEPLNAVGDVYVSILLILFVSRFPPCTRLVISAAPDLGYLGDIKYIFWHKRRNVS